MAADEAVQINSGAAAATEIITAAEILQYAMRHVKWERDGTDGSNLIPEMLVFTHYDGKGNNSQYSVRFLKPVFSKPEGAFNAEDTEGIKMGPSIDGSIGRLNLEGIVCGNSDLKRIITAILRENQGVKYIIIPPVRIDGQDSLAHAVYSKTFEQ